MLKNVKRGTGLECWLFFFLREIMDALTYSHFSYSRKNIRLKFLTVEASTFPGIQYVHLFVCFSLS